jgi:hypothetical protein
MTSIKISNFSLLRFFVTAFVVVLNTISCNEFQKNLVNQTSLNNMGKNYQIITKYWDNT